MKIVLNQKAQTGIKLALIAILTVALGAFLYNSFPIMASTSIPVTYIGANSRIFVSVQNESVTFTVNDTWYALSQSGVTRIDNMSNLTHSVGSANYTRMNNVTGSYVKLIGAYSNATIPTATALNVSYYYPDGYVNFTIYQPDNETIYYNKSNWVMTPFLNLTTNVSFRYCGYTPFFNGTYFPLGNGATTNRTWNNLTDGFAWDDVVNNTWVNLTFMCYNGTNTSSAGITNQTAAYAIGNWSFTNGTVFRFKIYASQSNTFGNFVNYTNNTWYKWFDKANISTTSGAANCSMVINGTKIVRLLNTTLLNQTAVYWTNVTSIKDETSYDTQWSGSGYNITYYCQDSFGNRSWYNASTNASLYIWVKKDSTVPWVTNVSFTGDMNYSARGKYVGVSFNASDVSTSLTCYIRGFRQEWVNQTVYNFSTERSVSTAASYHSSFINITPDDVKANGNYILQPYCTDAAGNGNVSDTNFTMTFYNLTTGWNLVTQNYNLTLREVGGLLPNITYVSVYDNNISKFNTSASYYTTFTVGGSTNAGFIANGTNTSLYIYVSRPNTLMTNYTDMTNGTPWTGFQNFTLWSNTSVASGWNQMGLIKPNATLFSIMYSSACNNNSAVSRPCQNITYVSVYDAQLGKFCSASRDRNATSCYPYTANNYTLPMGTAVWLYSTANITVNRTRIGNLTYQAMS